MGVSSGIFHCNLQTPNRISPKALVARVTEMNPRKSCRPVAISSKGNLKRITYRHLIFTRNAEL